MMISCWLKKQHVLTWCVQQKGELCCANAFYLFDVDKVAFYLLTEEKTRHAQMSGPKAHVAGTVNGQPQTIALIRGVQFKVDWKMRKATSYGRYIIVVSLLPECCQHLYGRSVSTKSNSLIIHWGLVNNLSGNDQ